jgi:putative spermidine/putrescine transport system substrate-binding protein
MRRRQILKATGAVLAAPVLAQLARPFDALAKTDQVIIMTWGGLWGDAMRDNVDTAYQKATGIKVLQDRSASPVERITKLKVSLDNQTVDLFQLADGLVPLAIKQGVAEKLNRASPRMPYVRNMIPAFWNDYWVPQIFSITGIIYNTKLVKNPPTAWADLWLPEFKGRIVLPEISHSIGSYIIPIGAVAQGKSPKDEAAGFEMLKKMADLRPIWAKDTDTMMNAMRTEDAVIGILYKSQTYTVKGWRRHRLYVGHLHCEKHQEPRGRRGIPQRHHGPGRAAVRCEDLQLRRHQQGHAGAAFAGAAGAGEVPARPDRPDDQARPRVHGR